MSTLADLVHTITTTAAARGMSASELARRAGVARETVSRLRSRKDADFGVLHKLGAAVGLDIVAVDPHARSQDTLPLSFPYNWSNSAMDADALIAAVLERALFADVLAVAAHHGLRRVRQVQHTALTPGPGSGLRDKALERMLRNIEAGFTGKDRPRANSRVAA